jgi:hypothetical protein
MGDTVGTVGLKNAAGARVNPATSERQDTGNASLALLEPAARCVAVAPNNGADLANNTRALMVSTAGDVVVDFVTTGASITLIGLQPGVVTPLG